MKRYQVLLALSCAVCSSDGARDGNSETEGIGSGTSPTSGASGEASGDASTADPTGDSGSDSSTNTPKYDVGAGGDFFCKDKDAGTYCDADNTAIVCGGNGDVADAQACGARSCLEDVGCVDCLAGQFGCQGDRVMVCDDVANPPQWSEIATCLPANNETCDGETGTCIISTPLEFPCTSDADCPQDGAYCDLTPGQCITGVYYKYADFLTTDGVFIGGYDVDSWENRLYVTQAGGVDVYDVELLDSDGDGLMEPNQHPDNPDEPGPIEQRVLTYVEHVDLGAVPVSSGASELFILQDRLYIGGSQITEHVFANAAQTVVATLPAWTYSFAQIGYDDVNQVWYASNEGARRVFQRNSTTGTWGIAFDYPELFGSHMDGLEVVTDPETGTPYVYVSDMTSDYIGQYRWDPEKGWVQENLFTYKDEAAALLEGMGFGALRHFWATSGSSLYEVGGGDIAQYVDPPG